MGTERVIETEKMTCVSSINSSCLPTSINEWDVKKDKLTLNLYFPPLLMIKVLVSLTASSQQHRPGNSNRECGSQKKLRGKTKCILSVITKHTKLLTDFINWM
ncbi:hypothetical protein AMECASPLE_024480 [Ameca splendens]|uniref:Uncharacterized protein n=1 Tax=Ameca splendens TaxID=208324 RepID=A0ABV0ZP87_9TELE